MGRLKEIVGSNLPMVSAIVNGSFVGFRDGSWSGNQDTQVLWQRDQSRCSIRKHDPDIRLRIVVIHCKSRERRILNRLARCFSESPFVLNIAILGEAGADYGQRASRWWISARTGNLENSAENL